VEHADGSPGPAGAAGAQPTDLAPVRDSAKVYERSRRDRKYLPAWSI
jgi:hypothetical protein